MDNYEKKYNVLVTAAISPLGVPGVPSGAELTARFLAQATREDLGRALFGVVLHKLGKPADSLDFGDAYTRGIYTLIGGEKVSGDPNIAEMVNTANILIYGEVKELDLEDVRLAKGLQ